MKKRDVIFAIAGVFLIGFALFCLRAKSISQSISCGNMMSSIGLGAYVWAGDNSNRLADNFICMSNELCAPRFLICPSDKARKAAISWESFTTNNSSYEILRPGMSSDDLTNAYFRCTIHGHLRFADGTVFDGTRRRTKWP